MVKVCLKTVMLVFFLTLVSPSNSAFALSLSTLLNGQAGAGRSTGANLLGRSCPATTDENGQPEGASGAENELTPQQKRIQDLQSKINKKREKQSLLKQSVANATDSVNNTFKDNNIAMMTVNYLSDHDPVINACNLNTDAAIGNVMNISSEGEGRSSLLSRAKDLCARYIVCSGCEDNNFEPFFKVCQNDAFIKSRINFEKCSESLNRFKNKNDNLALVNDQIQELERDLEDALEGEGFNENGQAVSASSCVKKGKSSLATFGSALVSLTKNVIFPGLALSMLYKSYNETKKRDQILARDPSSISPLLHAMVAVGVIGSTFGRQLNLFGCMPRSFTSVGLFQGLTTSPFLSINCLLFGGVHCQGQGTTAGGSVGGSEEQAQNQELEAANVELQQQLATAGLTSASDLANRNRGSQVRRSAGRVQAR